MEIKCKKKQTNRTASKGRILKGVRKRSMVYSTGGTLALLIQNAIFYGLIIAVYNGFHQKNVRRHFYKCKTIFNDDKFWELAHFFH